MYKHRNNFAFAPAVLGNVFDNMLSNKWDRVFTDDNWSNVTAPVNITETDKAYHLDLVAPGLNKEDFTIDIEKDVMTISFQHKEESKETTDKVIRNEYKFRSFKRSFTLTDKIDAAAVTASYTNGILKVVLPKTEQKENTTKKVEIA